MIHAGINTAAKKIRNQYKCVHRFENSGSPQVRYILEEISRSSEPVVLLSPNNFTGLPIAFQSSGNFSSRCFITLYRSAKKTKVTANPNAIMIFPADSEWDSGRTIILLDRSV